MTNRARSIRVVCGGAILNISKIETSAGTLDPRLSDPEVLAELGRMWGRTRRLRVDDALDPDLADALVDLAAAHPFTYLERHVSEVHGLFWRQIHALPSATTPAPDVLVRLRRLVMVDLPDLASRITGQNLHSAAGEGVAIDFYTRGSYLDAHTDQGSDRLIAYVIGLTAETWPAEEGGHLEFLGPDEHTVLDRIAPGYGTIDLFAIYPLTRPHRVPILRKPVTRLSINGWLTGELKGPGEP